MKTRTNQPIVLPSTADIEHLSDAFIDRLKCGDILTKQTGNLKHTYVVTYKEEKHGICISYFACGYLETISYDYTAGHWVFNSKDVCECADVSDVPTPTDIADLVVETIEDADEGVSPAYMLGLNGSGEFAKFPASSSEEVVAYEGTSLMPTGVSMSGWSLHRCIKNGNMLWLTITGSIINNTESSQTFMKLYSFTLPTSISSKIYRQNGTTCDTSSNSPTILYCVGVRGSSSGTYKLTSTTANVIEIESNNNINISAGNDVELEIRFPIFLDIGTASN